MGYGEVGGGGSLLWQVHYNKDEKRDKDPVAPANRKHYHGRDPEVAAGSKLLMAVDGEVVGKDAQGRLIIEVTIGNDPRQVQMYWGSDIDDAPQVARRQPQS
jgi:hypothetical protein